MKMLLQKSLVFLILVAGFSATVARSAPYKGTEPEGIFSVILHRGGTAYWLAHNHLMVADAKDANIDLQVEPANIEDGQFRITIDNQRLIVDDTVLHQQWNKRIRELGILSEDFIDLKNDDREKIRSQMLAQDQLDVVNFPKIQGELISLKKGGGSKWQVHFTHNGLLRMVIHGRTQDIPVLANVKLDSDYLSVEAVGSADLNDFGIKPMSALLGAVRVLPEFDIYANFRVRLVP
jgi:hypothetical protein